MKKMGKKQKIKPNKMAVVSGVESGSWKDGEGKINISLFISRLNLSIFVKNGIFKKIFCKNRRVKTNKGIV